MRDKYVVIDGHWTNSIQRRRIERKYGPDGVLAAVDLWCYCADRFEEGVIYPASFGLLADIVKVHGPNGEAMIRDFCGERLAVLRDLGDEAFEVRDWDRLFPKSGRTSFLKARAQSAADSRRRNKQEGNQ